MKQITEAASQEELPIKVLQYGEGNFLRAFVDQMIHKANQQGVFNGGVAIVKPIPYGNLDSFHAQDNLYTVCLRGKQDGQVVDDAEVITCVQKVLDAQENYADYMELAKLPVLEFVVSNTTEAGIVFDPDDRFEAGPPVTYPGKLAKFLHARFAFFNGAADKGLTMLPVELIEDNGKKLKDCVRKYAELWSLGADFAAWLDNSCVFCSTLVDRIVTGYPRDEAEAICQRLGYGDKLLDTAEPFGLWVIEGPDGVAQRFPLDKAGMPVVFTGDQRPYRERKVRILNGAHTSTVLAGYLCGKDTVGECMADPLIRKFMEAAVLEEILPTVPLPREEAEAFAMQVFQRFENPFVKHALLSISLNSVSKWKSRVLPSLRDSLAATGKLPPCLTFSLAALLAFYTGKGPENGALVGTRGETTYEIRDGAGELAFFAAASVKETTEYVHEALAQTDFWGMDLNSLPGFESAVTGYLSAIRRDGMASAMKHLFVK